MTTRYRTIDVDEVKVFFREAGPADAPALLLLHGFPTSSHMFRELIPALGDRYHVVAPDLPGFGFTEVPARAGFKYSFEHLTDVIDRFTEALGPRSTPSRADHRCDLTERQRLSRGAQRGMESDPSLLE